MRLYVNNQRKKFADIILYITASRQNCVGYRGCAHHSTVTSPFRRFEPPPPQAWHVVLRARAAPDMDAVLWYQVFAYYTTLLFPACSDATRHDVTTATG